MPFEKIATEQHAAFVSSLKAGQYNLLLGSGASMDSTNAKGDLPSGSVFRDELAALKGANPSQPLQRIFALLDPSEVTTHVTRRFSNCTPGPSYLLLSTFLWKRAFTFNVDDAMEAAYAKAEAKQTLLTYNFDNEYEDERTIGELPLVYLHGTVKRPATGYIFSREQYIKQITSINPWMTVLSQFIRSEPFVLAGTSMDEVDLDFYLAHRSPGSARDDRGPSIRIEPFPDNVTRNDCEQHGLLLFVGTTHDFLAYCESVAPNRPTPYELVPAEEQKLIPAGISKATALSFLSDFELVPGTEQTSNLPTRFLYGHPPTWQDLASDLDIPRTVTSRVVSHIERRLGGLTNDPRFILLRESTGTGKTTVLRRCAFELSQRGIRVLNCSTLSRVEPISTSEVIDLVDGPLVLIVDNFADQVGVFSELLDRLEKTDVIILAADRSYRFRHIQQALSGRTFAQYGELDLKPADVERLIDNYVKFGLVGSQNAIKQKPDFAKRLSADPIAVACSRILNDFRPLDGIIDGILKEGTNVERDRYIMSALAQHCFRGGVRYEVLAAAVGRDGLKEQLGKDHVLPLAFSEDRSRSFVVPQNATLAQRILTLQSESHRDQLLESFVALANQIAPRVNRSTIKRRTPEARLAVRLFDFDAVTGALLKDRAFEFYQRTQPAWQWNSRYWEQIALLHLARFFASPGTADGIAQLETAAQHARHAVSVEHHPLPLTTLGKILLAQMGVPEFSMTSSYTEAFDNLTEAIRLEKAWSRKAIQPYVSLFHGTVDFLQRGGVLSVKQADQIQSLMRDGEDSFGRDPDMNSALAELNRALASAVRS